MERSIADSRLNRPCRYLLCVLGDKQVRDSRFACIDFQVFHLKVNDLFFSKYPIKLSLRYEEIQPLWLPFHILSFCDTPLTYGV